MMTRAKMLFVVALAGCGDETAAPPCHGVDVIDKPSGEHVLATAAEAQNGILQGRYLVQSERMRVTKAGKFGTIATEDLMTSFGQGYDIADPVQSTAIPKCTRIKSLRARAPGECTWCAKQ
jgi:hypothetical protein